MLDRSANLAADMLVSTAQNDAGGEVSITQTIKEKVIDAHDEDMWKLVPATLIRWMEPLSWQVDYDSGKA